MTFHRIGLADDITDFVNASPQQASAMQDVTQQALAEGADALELNARKDALVSTYKSMVSELGVDPHEALAAAQKYVKAAKTIEGAVSSVQGLVAASEKGAAPAQVIQTFTGILVAAAVASGVATAGIGAAIVGAVAVITSILDKFHLLGGPPDGTEVCPGVTCSAPPKYVVNCICVYTDVVSTPASPNWKRFPNPDDPDDYRWFVYGPLGVWKGFLVDGKWTQATWLGGKYGGRPIDVFTPYARFECETKLSGSAGEFQKMFFGAWKLNQELILNGIKAGADWQVLLSVMRMWNRAHASGNDISFNSTPKDVSPKTGMDGVDAKCAPDLPPYFTTLIRDITNSDPTNTPNGSLVIHGGAKKIIKNRTFAPALTAAPAPTSTTSKVLIGTAAVGALAAGSLYFYAGKKGLTMVQAAKSLFPKRIFHTRENPLQLEGRTVAYRVQLDGSDLNESVILSSRDHATLYRNNQPFIHFRPLPYQLAKIRSGHGELLIYTDQILSGR